MAKSLTRIAAALALGSVTSGVLIAGGTSPAQADSCSIPATADDGVIITIQSVLDAEGASDKVRLATFEAAWVESHVNNLPCGDADSVGVFQQRPSAGWIHASDPGLATNDFLYGNPSDSSAGAIAIAAMYPTWSAGKVAQAVQRSAFPGRYDEVETTARDLMARAVELAGSTERASGHSVVSDQSGRMWSFAVTLSGTLKYRFTGVSGWQPWVTVGSGYKSVAAALDGTGRVMMAYVTDDDVLKVRRTNGVPTASYTGNGFAGSSAAFGAGDWANVSLATDRLGRVWLAASKTYGRAYFMHQNASGDWPTTFNQFGNGNWRSVSISAESDSDGRVWMFGTKTDGDLWYRHTDSTLGVWDPMTSAGSGWAGDVSATGDTVGRMWMFGVKSDGTLMYRHTDSSGWGNYVTVPQSGWVSVSSGVKSTTGAVWMFGTQANGDLFYRYTDGSGDGWNSLAAVPGGPWK